MALNHKAEKWLEARTIDTELAVKYGVNSSEKRGGDWIEIPYTMRGERVNTKYRNIVSKEFSQDPDGQKCVWNFDCLRDDSLKNQPLIITEGEMDALAVIQSGYSRVVSVPDGAPAKTIEGNESKKYSYLEDIFPLLKECKEIIIAADGDQAGANLLHDLALRFGKSRCKWVPYPKGCKDLNDAMMRYGTKGVVESINRATWVRVDGVYTMGELPPAPSGEAMTTGITFLDPHYKIRYGDFCVMTGIPSHGKSTFANQLVASMVQTHGVNACFASFEQHPTLDHKRNLRQLHIGHNGAWNRAEIAAADAWIEKHFRFMVPNEDDDVTLAWVLEKATVAVVRHNCKIVVIDPWNEMDHMRPSDMSLTEYTGFAIKELKKFARNHHIHLIVVAHPTKLKKNAEGGYDMPSLYDVSDSAHWANKADVGVVIHRKGENDSVIRIAKSRYHNIIGKPGDVAAGFDVGTNQYFKNGI